ncbi:hypothetical protein ARMGADRAFT_801867 [Armillaria gallica]|uniref:Uncharacterized protein n=1 Tax=Armillaria gallica TaxID=47427 RepID=A0A2H3DJT6_ARMGA|nr:hypothetical protein ARMGADRAFT_801867 [Armillaria gallica]
MTTAQLDSTNRHHHVFYQPSPPPPPPTTRPPPSSPTSPIGCMPPMLSPHQSPLVTHLMASTSDIATWRSKEIRTIDGGGRATIA